MKAWIIKHFSSCANSILYYVNKNSRYCKLSLVWSSLSHNVVRSLGTTDDFTISPLHLDWSSAVLVELAKRNPSETESIKSQISSKTSSGKKTAQKDTIKDITSDSQLNSNFPYRWSPASLTFNIYYFLFLYLYITRITINNNTPHLDSTKNQNRRAALGRQAIKLLEGVALTSLRSINPRPCLRLGSIDKTITTEV